MEENVCASLLSLVLDDLTSMVRGVAENQPNACAGSRITAKMERAFLIFLGMMDANNIPIDCNRLQ